MTLTTGVGRGFGGGPNVKWTPTQDARIRELAGMGKSTAEVAAILGVNKNQVVGRSRRMQEPRPQWALGPFGNGKGVARPRPLGRPRRRHNGVRMSEDDPVPQAPPPSLDVVVMDLRDHHCRYPYGERSPFLFCGAAPVKGSSYCSFHRAMTCDPRPRAPVSLPPTIKDA